MQDKWISWSDHQELNVIFLDTTKKYEKYFTDLAMLSQKCWWRYGRIGKAKLNIAFVSKGKDNMKQKRHTYSQLLCRMNSSGMFASGSNCCTSKSVWNI